MAKVLPIDDLLEPSPKVQPIDDLFEDETLSTPRMSLGQSVLKAARDTNPTADMAIGPIPGLVNRVKQNFFGIHPEQDPTNIGEFAKDYFTDPRTYIYAGAGAMGGLPKAPNIGGFVKSLKPVPMNPMAAEEAVGTFRARLKSMDPLALRQAGIPEDQISKIQSYKGQYGATEIPTTESAGGLFNKAWEGAPDDFSINVKPLKGKLGANLRSKGMIDERGSLVPGVTKDSRQMQGLMDVYSNLKSRVKMNEDIPGALNETVRPKLGPWQKDPKTGQKFAIQTPDSGALTSEAKATINKAIKNPDKMNKPLYERTKIGLRALLGADEQANLPIYQMLDELETAAERSGVKGLRQARSAYNIAKESDKAQNIIKGVDTTAEKSMQTLIKRLEDPMDRAARKELIQKVGQEKASKLIQDADARILRSKNIGNLKKATGIGLIFGGAKFGIGKTREAINSMKSSK